MLLALMFHWGSGNSVVRLHLKLMAFIWGFPCGSAGKESACNAGDLDSIPGLGRSPGEGKIYPLQYSGVENSMDHSPWCRKESDTTEQLSLSHLEGWQAASKAAVFTTIPPVLLAGIFGFHR